MGDQQGSVTTTDMEEIVVTPSDPLHDEVLIGHLWYSVAETTMPDGSLACIAPNASSQEWPQSIPCCGMCPLLLFWFLLKFLIS